MTRKRSFKTGRWRALALLTAWGAALAAGALAAEPAAPGERQRGEGLLAAVAAGDAEALAAYMEENFTAELWAQRSPQEWHTLALRLGRHQGLELTDVEVRPDHHLELAAESPDGTLLRFLLDFEPQPPHRIAAFGVEAEAGGHGPRGPELPPFEPPAGGTEAALVAALGGWFDQLAAADLFSGTALVARHGRPIFTAAYGLAYRPAAVPNRLTTRFDLGSINKDFTRVAIAQLAAQGKLALGDSIADHLPDYPNAEVAAKVTVRQLLQHSAGLGDIFTEEYRRSNPALYRGPRDFFPLFADRPLAFEPGSQQRYSNAGYMVLGAIVEAASGERYADYVQRHVFAPAGMEASGFFAHDEPVPEVAVGYTRWGEDEDGEGELRNNLFHLPVVGNSAGSAQSTVGDLLRFDEALREHRLLPPAWTAWFFDGPEPAAAGGDAAPATAPRARGHMGIAGGAPGVSAVLESDGELTLVVLSNYDPPITETIMQALWKPLLERLGSR